MAVDLHGGDSLLSYQPLAGEDYEILHPHNNPSILNHSEKHEKKDEDDFVVGLTSNMDAYFMFQSKVEKQLDGSSSSTVSDKSDEIAWPSWGFADSPEYKLWSPPLSSKHSTGVSSPTDNKDPFGYGSSFDQSYNELNMKFKKISMNGERDSKLNKGHGFLLLDSPAVISSSNGSPLVDDQIQALQKELKMKTYWEIKAQSLQHSQTSKGNLQHYHTNKAVKAIGYRNSRQRVRPVGVSCSGVGTVAGRQQPQQPQKYQRTGLNFNAVSLGRSNARSGSCGTGVFLPRTTATCSESRKKSGCSTVLIPARVVQALQQHFDQIGITTSKKTGSLPPLHDVLVHNKDGMYSLQKRYSYLELESVSNHSQTETSLPREWTY